MALSPNSRINPGMARRRLGAPPASEQAVKDALRPLVEAIHDRLDTLEAKIDALAKPKRSRSETTRPAVIDDVREQ